MLFQSIPALKERYPNDAHLGILGNTDISVFLGTTDPLTADFVSRRAGETSVLVESEMESHNKFDITRFSAEYRQSQGVGKRMILTQDEVLTMGKDNSMRAIIIMKDQPILMCEKFDFERDPASKRWEPFSMNDFNPRDPLWFDAEPAEEAAQPEAEPVLPDGMRDAFARRGRQESGSPPKEPTEKPESVREPGEQKPTSAQKPTGTPAGRGPRKRGAAKKEPKPEPPPQQSIPGFFGEPEEDDLPTLLSTEQKKNLAPNPVIGEKSYRGSGVEL